MQTINERAGALAAALVQQRPRLKHRLGKLGNRIPTIEVYLGRGELMGIVRSLKESKSAWSHELCERLATLALSCPYPDEEESVAALASIMRSTESHHESK